MMPTKPRSIESTGLIIGEGKDELELLTALVGHLGLVGVRVEEYRGKARLREFLEDLPGRADFGRLRRLCITRDLDHRSDPEYQALESVIQSLGDALARNDLPRPPACEVVVGEPSGVQVGIFLMPGGGRDGAFEDLFLESIADDPATPCVDDYFRCLEARGVARPSLKSMDAKARVHAWLASREVSDLARMGLASQKSYVPWDHVAFDPLKTFLRTLFDAPRP